MLDERTLRQAEQRVAQYLKEGTIKTNQEKEFVDFFLSNADKSLTTANALFELSTSTELQQTTGYHQFDGYLWVVNASYYSMFYLTRALLESQGIKLKTELSVHALTFDALVVFFYINQKLQKSLVDDFVVAKQEASELLGKQKSDQLIEEYYWEKRKRATFTYKTDQVIIKTKAQTSLERARRFNQEIKQIIE